MFENDYNHSDVNNEPEKNKPNENDNTIETLENRTNDAEKNGGESFGVAYIPDNNNDKKASDNAGNGYTYIPYGAASQPAYSHTAQNASNEVKKKKPNAQIIYIKGEDFTNQLIEALASQKTSEFRNTYRSCDMLLIDDIQFIAGKVSTQEEFFHTFNALYEEHKQIILTSDRPPREIKTLEDRLKTRFEWGLIADIQPPDLELRIAIIKKKAEQVGIIISDEVLTYLAENLRSNIRQIEGAIKKLAALSFLSGREISMDTAESCISELLGGAEPTSVTVDRIFAAVSKKYGIKREDIVGQKRNKEIAQARHICNYLIRNITDMSLPNIGKIFNRHYSTVISSVDFVDKKIKTDPLFALEIKNLKKEITGTDAD